jgi:uncharacterized membrane protein YcaP (DUF421 family)
MYTVIFAVFGYFFLLLTVRVMARRPGGQLTMFDFVLIFLIGGVIIAATAANDRSVTNCTCAVIVVGMVHRFIAVAKAHYPKLGAVVDGVPLVLRRKGEWKDEAMRRVNVETDDVLAAGRCNGLRSLDEIEYAVLERSGEISTMKAKEK